MGHRSLIGSPLLPCPLPSGTVVRNQSRRALRCRVLVVWKLSPGLCPFLLAVYPKEFKIYRQESIGLDRGETQPFRIPLCSGGPYIEVCIIEPCFRTNSLPENSSLSCAVAFLELCPRRVWVFSRLYHCGLGGAEPRGPGALKAISMVQPETMALLDHCLGKTPSGRGKHWFLCRSLCTWLVLPEPMRGMGLHDPCF